MTSLYGPSELTKNQNPIKPEVPAKPEVNGEPSVGARVKRERDPELDEILASARVRKVPRTHQEIEVVDLLDD